MTAGSKPCSSSPSGCRIAASRPARTYVHTCRCLSYGCVYGYIRTCLWAGRARAFRIVALSQPYRFSLDTLSHTAESWMVILQVCGCAHTWWRRTSADMGSERLTSSSSLRRSASGRRGGRRLGRGPSTSTWCAVEV
eukprot:scaffold85894_cov67-Phaeocystis_antarctica.AAC.10